MGADLAEDRGGPEAAREDDGGAGVQALHQRIEEQRVRQRARRHHHVLPSDAEFDRVAGETLGPRAVVAAIALRPARRARGEADIEARPVVGLGRPFVPHGRTDGVRHGGERQVTVEADRIRPAGMR